LIRRIPLAHYKLGGSQICSISVSCALVIQKQVKRGEARRGECRLKRGWRESRFGGERMVSVRSDVGIISRERLPLLDLMMCDFEGREPEMAIDAELHGAKIKIKVSSIYLDRQAMRGGKRVRRKKNKKTTVRLKTDSKVGWWMTKANIN
jgi:hypothetical protein